MIAFFTKLRDFLTALITRLEKSRAEKMFGAARSPEWGRVRREHLKKHPECIVCGGTKTCEVHHLRPFHTHPHLELDPKNLVTLCEGVGTFYHHLWIGHLGNYKSINEHCVEDAKLWREKIQNRPR